MSSCIAKKELPQNDFIAEENPKLIFLNYTVKETSNGTKSIDFISKKITDGKARNNGNKYTKTGSIGDLKFSQVDKNARNLHSVFIKNPLHKHLEFINDSLQFESKALELKKSSLFLRLQLHADTENIIISEVTDSLQNTRPIYITKLDTK
ncbi:hypothetical protein GCM10022291_29480 [Postechiella marina]|uniref:Lipoprotein n=1 Tax=Postechiella marina TaxID=943941 RepID=A0ABP8CF77_9FLAO